VSGLRPAGPPEPARSTDPGRLIAGRLIAGRLIAARLIAARLIAGRV
jgi:hypothetical protein